MNERVLGRSHRLKPRGNRGAGKGGRTNLAQGLLHNGLNRRHDVLDPVVELPHQEVPGFLASFLLCDVKNYAGKLWAAVVIVTSATDLQPMHLAVRPSNPVLNGVIVSVLDGPPKGLLSAFTIFRQNTLD